MVANGAVQLGGPFISPNPLIIPPWWDVVKRLASSGTKLLLKAQSGEVPVPYVELARFIA